MRQAAEVDEAIARAEPRLSYAIARLQQMVLAGISERVAQHDLTTLQFTTLSVLSRHGAPLSTSQLARRAFMTPQSMSEVIHALERKGLIERNPTPITAGRFRRRSRRKGGACSQSCEEAVTDFESAMLEGFSADDRAAFLDMIKAAVRNLGGGFPD